MSDIRGIATVIFPTSNLEESKTWWTKALGMSPYMDQPSYVGYNVNGYELGLNPEADSGSGPVAYFRVESIVASLAHFVGEGCSVVSDVSDVGDGVKLAALKNPEGCVFGLIENPDFKPSN